MTSGGAQQLGEHYTMLAELGRGGMAVVHRARDVRHGRTDEARALLAELERRAQEDPTICAPAIATLHLHLGDHAAFYRWMHKAYDVRDPFALGLNGEYLWDPARGEPEFQALLERVGLAR